MIVRVTGYDFYATFFQSFAECLGVLQNLLLILFKFRLKCFLEAHCFCCDHMHKRSSLDSREYCFVKVELLIHLIAGEDHTASGSSQCLMRRSRRHMRIRDRLGWSPAATRPAICAISTIK